ncbi:penicillin acylase family protein [Cognatiluteimonas profundi]|uniref:penicillin acylase family protein n=1 Tax=Cognatiluteimonas profundi TaxID=2594501 RepID=UPI00131D1FAA|nr:penicillin acylase family protein [Lysobacter profundi]
MAIWLKRIAVALTVLLMLAGLSGWLLLRGSLPTLDGAMSLPGLSAPVTIQRDHLGVVTVDAANELDAMRALGYVHAQERFFEMDLMRRTAAGELAELFGPIAVKTDRQHRVHRMRTRAIEDLATFAGPQRAVLQAYVEGINAGLSDLKVRPWPYLLLRTKPRPWQLADTPLVGFAMYFDLQDAGNQRELAMSRIRQVVPPVLYALLSRDGTRWDAPLMGQARGDAVLPDAAELDLRTSPIPRQPRPLADLPAAAQDIGSNSFAVSGALTRDGRAIVADDMHLALRVPNIWFRARLRYRDAQAPGGKVDTSGFTLPGLPMVVVGSNGHVAWGFTNSYIDTADWAAVPGCHQSTGPRTACLPTAHERIAVAGAPDVDLAVAQWTATVPVPVLQTDAGGDDLVGYWAAQAKGAVNLDLNELARADTLDNAIALSAPARIPTQNMVIVDRAGQAAWTLVGGVPDRRPDCRGNLAFDQRCIGWRLRDKPEVASQIDGSRLWTANNRILDGAALAQLGNGGYALGARARQIRDDLLAKNTFTERDLLAIQLDDRAVFLQRWWQLLQSTATSTRSPALDALAEAASTWDGHASTDSVSYRVVRAWRLAVHARLLDGLTAPAQVALGERFLMPDLPQFEGVAWPLVTQRPRNLLPRRFASWNALFEDAARAVRDDPDAQGTLSSRTWGERNTARICHPLSKALPAFARGLLCMPFDPLPGDSNMPRVAGPDFGASERMVVSPGHEADGFIHMPGGQSGNPLSPYWGAGHEDWVHGRATPFLPGKAEHTLHFVPGLRSGH